MTPALDAIPVTSTRRPSIDLAILCDLLCLLLIAFAWLCIDTAPPSPELQILVGPAPSDDLSLLLDPASSSAKVDADLLSITVTPKPSPARALSRLKTSLGEKRKSVSFSIATTIDEIVHSPRRRCSLRPLTPFYPRPSTGPSAITPRARPSHFCSAVDPLGGADDWEEFVPPTPIPSIVRHSTDVVDPMEVKKEWLMA